MWQPLGKVWKSMFATSAASSVVACSPAAAFFRCVSASARMSMPRSVPTMVNRPSAKPMSATAASSTSAAACLPLAITVSAVTKIAWPSEYRLRAPPVPPPTGMVSVSP